MLLTFLSVVEPDWLIEATFSSQVDPHPSVRRSLVAGGILSITFFLLALVARYLRLELARSVTADESSPPAPEHSPISSPRNLRLLNRLPVIERVCAYTSGIFLVVVLLLASRAERWLPLLIGIMGIVLVASLSVSCAACLLPRGYAMRGGRLIAAMIALAGAVSALCARAAEVSTHKPVRLNLINAYLNLERTSMFPGGVSCILPVGFLAAAWFAWIYMRLRRASHLRQTPLVLFEDRSGPSEQDIAEEQSRLESGSSRPETVISGIQRQVRAVEFMATADANFQTPILPYFLLLAGIGSLSFVPVVYDALVLGRWQTFELRFFDFSFGFLFLCMVFLILLRLSWLLALWSCINKALRSIMHLPMRTAFDRLPRRVARWFFEVTSGKEGPDAMLDLQARALRNALEDEARDGILIQAAASEQTNSITSDDLSKLRQMLASDCQDSHRSLGPVLNLLCGLWSGFSVADAFAESTQSGEATKENPWMNAPRLRRLNDSDREHLASIGLLAEDYVALHFVRWLGLIMDHVWGTINFLAIAVPALLLSVSSYPFISQGRLLMGISVIVVACVLVILIIVIGLNRDELVSLASNTKPHGLSLDHGLMMSLVTYVVPLLFGIAFAISYDLSDILKSMLDPLFRMMD
jgi:hypothetical protein